VVFQDPPPRPPGYAEHLKNYRGGIVLLWPTPILSRYVDEDLKGDAHDERAAGCPEED